jgi:hypothetical protein
MTICREGIIQQAIFRAVMEHVVNYYGLTILRIEDYNVIDSDGGNWSLEITLVDGEDPRHADVAARNKELVNTYIRDGSV